MIVNQTDNNIACELETPAELMLMGLVMVDNPQFSPVSVEDNYYETTFKSGDRTIVFNYPRSLVLDFAHEIISEIKDYDE